MELDLQQIQAISTGACRVTQTDDGFHFYRYTDEQMEMYVEREKTGYKKYLCTSGIALHFRTDSKVLNLSVSIRQMCSRSFFAFDLMVNGQYRDSLKNFDPSELSGKFSDISLPLEAEYSRTFSLGEGMKEVKLLFPWSVEAVITSLSLDDGAELTPVKLPKTLLAFGDSITQGYDALFPSHKYITRLAHFLNAREFNKGYGGEIFWPELGATRENFAPDYIVVAYGTNDWSRCERADVEANCTGFYQNLAKSYPNAQIYALTPLWRKLMDMEKPAGPFRDIDKIIREATRDCPNITVISGMDLIPHDSAYFADLTLHPNDMGFECYFNGLKACFG